MGPKSATLALVGVNLNSLRSDCPTEIYPEDPKETTTVADVDLVGSKSCDESTNCSGVECRWAAIHGLERKDVNEYSRKHGT